MKEITYVRHRMELGKDAYRLGKISNERMDELCDVLLDFKRMMKEYGVTEFRACATAVIRELEGSFLILDRIFVKTGIQVEILSNSELRYLSYKYFRSTVFDCMSLLSKL